MELLRGESALERLNRFIESRGAERSGEERFEEFERELHRHIVEVERELLSQELSAWDVDIPYVEIEGRSYRRVLGSETNYMSAAGVIRVERSLYRSADCEQRSLCPLESRAGIVERWWTPRAASQALYTLAQMPAGEAQKHFAQMENMEPSRSSLERLPKKLDERWEARRLEFEQALRGQMQVPQEATTVAVSLDGVMVPMRDGQRQEKRQRSPAQGKEARGPAGHRQVGCATLSFYDDEGERLSTLRLGRMPEAHKATLKATLSEELSAVLSRRPKLRIVKLADGPVDNWTYLSGVLPVGVELVDFYHAASHLKAAFDQAYSASSVQAESSFAVYRRILRDEADGAEKVIRALAYRHKKHPRRKNLAKELKYFRRHRHRMRYAQAKAEALPIGSGVVEAACNAGHPADEKLRHALASSRWTSDLDLAGTAVK